MTKKISTGLAAALMTSALVLLPTLSWAVTPTVPTSAQPGVIQNNLEQQTPEAPQSGGVIVVPEEKNANKKYSSKKEFVLREVVLDRPNLYSPDMMLHNMYGDLIGQKVSFADLSEVANRVTRKYREDGYIFSRAILPPQKIKDGVVHLRAVEGRIINVKLVGHFKDKDGLIQKYADDIDRVHAANAHDIERHLLLINDLPGITAKSFIKPSAEAGGGDLIIDIEEKAFEGSVSVDNRGSDYLGPYRGTLVGAFNDTLGLHDRTTLRGIMTDHTDELKFGDITHEEQLGSSGARLTLRAAYTVSNPKGDISNEDIHGDSQMYDAEMLYPLVRSRQYNFNLVGGFNLMNSTTDVLDNLLSDDRVRTARAGTRFDTTDSLGGVNQFEVMGTKGLSGLGSTPNGVGRSRFEAESNFLKADATATRVQQLPDLWSVSLSGTSQWSDRALLSSEQLSLGGPTYGRGFDEGEVTGDDGVAGVAELRYGGPVPDNKILQSYQAYVFSDYGRVTNRDIPAGTPGEYSTATLTSAGLGVRMNFQQDFTGYVELDKPMDRAPVAESDNGSRLFFSVLKRF
jgi:hemolysin activation/secretion protein